MKKKINTFRSPHDLRKTVLELLASSNKPLTKNEIARQLSVRGDERIALKNILSDLEATGKLNRGPRRRVVATDRTLNVGQVIVAEIIAIGEDAEFIAIPLEWTQETPSPRIELNPLKRTHPKHKALFLSLEVGSHVLIRLQSQIKGLWLADIIKKLEKTAKVHLGLFTPNRNGGGRLSSCHRKDTFPGARLIPAESENLQDGDIVTYSVSSTDGLKIHQKIGRIDDPKSFSQMAIYSHNLPHEFSPEAIALSEQGKIPDLTLREDFRDIPLVTIDGEDARDFDDAVFAIADENPQNLGGWRILVAIADVSFYVRPGMHLIWLPATAETLYIFPTGSCQCSLKPYQMNSAH